MTIASDFAALGVVLIESSGIPLIRWSRNLTPHPRDRVMLTVNGQAVLYVDPACAPWVYAHEIGHALVWRAAGKPLGVDWASRPGAALAGSERAATRAGLAYAKLRGIDHTGQAGEMVPDDDARALLELLQ